MTSRTWRSAVAAGLAVLVVVGAWRELASFPGDRRTREWVFAHPVLPSGVRDLSGLLSVLGTPAVALVTLLVAGVAARPRWGARDAWALALAVPAVLLAKVLQDVLGGGADQRIATAYPSGHVVWAAAMFGTLALLARRHRVPEVVWPCVLVVVLMGPERVVTGAHGVSDVLGGYGLGIAWAVAASRWAGRGRRGPVSRPAR
jgi:undecaprenyl-diphosphatase